MKAFTVEKLSARSPDAGQGSARMTQEPERLAGRWSIDGELGRGGMGRVLLVRDTCAGGVPLAAKVLERPELRDDFLQELELLRQLAHPGFPAARGLVLEATASGRIFALMERIEGAPLGPDRAREAGPELVAIAGDLLRALDHLHRHGKVHGDLAPGNVLWRRGARPRIIDLGAGGERGDRTGRTSGVLAYQPPERLSGAPLAPAGDLWSLGAVLFGVAHGRHPFPGWPAVSRAGGPDRQGLAPHALDPLLDRLLAADPADRFPHAAAALAELEASSGVPQPLATAAADVEWPFVDTGHMLESALERVGRARGREPVVIDVAAPRGGARAGCASWRSGSPDMVCWCSKRRSWTTTRRPGCPRCCARSATTSTASAKASRPSRAPTWPSSSMTSRACRARARPPCACAALRWSSGALVTAGLGPADVTLPSLSPDDVEALLANAFPRRLIAGKLTATLCDVAHGNAGRLTTLAKMLLARGALVVDSANVSLPDAKAAFTLASELADDDAPVPAPVEPPSPLALAEQALSAATSPEARYTAALAVGRLEARASRFPKALVAFRVAREVRADAEVLAGLARAAVMSGDLTAAEQACDEGMALVGAGQDAVRAGLLYTRALVDWYRGAIDEAEPRLATALETARAAGERAEEAAITTAIGLIAHRRGDLVVAAQRYREALRLGEAAGDEARVLSSLQNLGVVFHERGDWTEALDTYRHALALAEALDQRGRVAQIAGNLGNLWRYLGELERADAAL
ncbi:MAG: tetratricopeptide repeat protein, partial [Myxococcota bacterium]